MTIQTYWQLDVAQDENRSEISRRSQASHLVRDVRTPAINRYDYYAQVAQAAAQTGFDGLFLPHRPQSDDSGIVTAAIAREVPRLTLIPELPASSGSAVYAAKQAVSFQRAAHGRLAWAIAPDPDAQTRAQSGDFVPDDQLHARTEEFLTVARGVHANRPFSYAGTHFQVQNGGFDAPLNRVAFPTVFLQGDSEEALSQSAALADVHLFRSGPVDRLRSLIEGLDRLAVQAGRSLAFGLIQEVLAREEEGEARIEAERRGIAPSALVGDYHQVASHLAALAQLGISHFVLTAPSSLEEAYRVGQHVLPRFRALTQSARAAA